MPRPKRIRFGARKRVRCRWCHGKHLTNKCPDPQQKRKVTRLFGTTDPITRSYIPPQGVSVRVMSIPITMDSHRLRRALRELDGIESV